MTIALVAGQAASGTGTGTSPQATLAAAPTQNNLLVAMVGSASAVTALNAASGWTGGTEITSTRRGRMFYKVAGAGESATQTPASLGTSRNWACIVTEYTVTATSSPLDVEGANIDDDGTKLLTTSVDPVDGVERLMVGGGFVNDTTDGLWSSEKVNNATTSVNERKDVANSAGVSIVLFDKVEASTATGAYTVEATTTNAAGGIFLMIFKPLPASTTAKRLPLLGAGI